MSDLSAEGVVTRYFDALNARDFARAAGAIAEDCRWESVATERVFTGHRPIIEGLQQFVEGFPDWHVTVEAMRSWENVVVVEWVTAGTFTGTFRGEPPNGRAFRRRGCSVAEVRGAKIVHYRDYYDRATLFEPLGLMHLLRR